MSWVCFWRKSSRMPDVFGEIVPDVRIKMSESEDVRIKMSESESRPSKCTGSNLHPIWIGSEAGLLLDQICVAKSWHFQPELYWVQAGFTHFPASAPPKIITVLLDPYCFKLHWANSPVSGSHRARPDLGQWEPTWLVPHETAAVSAQVLCTPYNHVNTVVNNSTTDRYMKQGLSPWVAK